MEINDVAGAHEKYEQLIKEATALNTIAVFEALAAAAISTVTVTFDGEGDSGQIDWVVAFVGDKPQALPDTTIQLHQASWSAGELTSAQLPLDEAVKDLCYDCLSAEHGGWENNDGGFGDFTFNVAKRTIELEFSARYTDTTHYSHTF